MASRLTWIVLLLLLALYGIFAKTVVLGLDLAGGVTLRFELLPPDDGVERTAEQMSSDIDATIETLRTRINAGGIKESAITRQGDNEIVVELPGSSKDEADTIRSVISRVGNLQFAIALRPDGSDDDTRNGVVVSAETERLKTLLEDPANRGRTPDELNLKPLDVVIAEDGVTYRWVPHSDNWIAQDRRGPDIEIDDENPLADILAEVPLVVGDFAFMRLETDEGRRFTGADVADTRPTTDDGGGTAVLVEMRPDRAGAFADWTGPNKGRLMGITLDGRLPQPAAEIQSRLGRQFRITSGRPAGFSQTELTTYLTVIKSGSLQMKPRLLSENTVGPSLGEASISAGTTASLAGFAAIILFMLIYYRMSGAIASACLIVNMTLLTGVLMFLGATLTLPGIAGLVLTLGMAVDANILIFERIREESDRAKSVGQAVKLGFEKATSTILDANITSFVTAMILYNVGTGPVRGFAVILMMGILTSVFSVLVFGRVIYDWLVANDKANVAMGRLLKGETTIPFLSKRKGAMVLSTVLVAGSLVGFAATDRDKYGLDFTGGYKAHVRLTQAVEQADVKGRVDKLLPDTSVISVGDGESASGSTQFVVKVKEAAEEGDQSDLKARYEVPLKQALAGLIRPDFVTDLTLTEDAVAQSTAISGLMHFESAVSPDTLRPHLGGVADLELSAEGGAVRVAGVLPLTELDESAVVQRLRSALAEVDGVTPSAPFLESTTIGSRVGTELRDSAWRAIILSFIAIVLYIRVRFREYRYGFAAIVALAHDVTITLGVVAVTHTLGFVDVEIDLAMIAAFLTIIGYSLNDTIVLFDRVRENLPRLKGKSFEEVLDISINQTLGRTLLTSMTTLTALVIIFVVNYGKQNVLEGFSFAMILGVLVGTYSSIFVASPVLTLLAGNDKGSGASQAKASTSGSAKVAKTGAPA